MSLVKETEVFSTNEEARQAARLKKIQEAETKIKEQLEAEMKERDTLRLERARNRAKRAASSSSSSSSSSSALPATKRNIGFSYGIGPDDIPGEGEDSVIEYHNWNDFQERLDDLEEEKTRLSNNPEFMKNLDKRLERHERMDNDQYQILMRHILQNL
jgi:hypothetical protein